VIKRVEGNGNLYKTKKIVTKCCGSIVKKTNGVGKTTKSKNLASKSQTGNTGITLVIVVA